MRISLHLLFFFQEYILVLCTSSKEQLARVADEYWNYRLSEYPERATSRGVHAYDDRLEEYTLEAFDRRRISSERILADLQSIDQSQLTPRDLMDYKVLEISLQTYIDGYQWRNYGALSPLSAMEGLQRRLGYIRKMRYDTVDDFRLYITRIRQTPQQLEQMIGLMREAMRRGRTNHITSMLGVPETLDFLINVTSARDHFYFIPMNKLDVPEFDGVDTRTKEELINTTKNIIMNELIPAFQRLQRFLVEEYMPACRSGAGVGSYPGGVEYYEACLRYHVTKNVTAHQVREIGLREVERIKLRMETIMSAEGFNGTLKEFFIYLHQNRSEEFYGRTEEELLDEYRNLIFNRINPKMHKIFYWQQIPDRRIRVSKMPADGPSGGYGSGVFFANSRRSEDRPSFLMLALCLHEANPGHHLQTHYAKSISDLQFRRHLWTDRYHAVPFTTPHFTAYVEGWGLYAEYLGVELGLYDNSKLEMIGRYSSEMFRAVRLVIDTGMHAFNMTRDEAISYLAEYTAIPLVQIEKEVDRYIMWPGQACAYKMGEITMLQLRQEAEEALGDKFDIREFHAQVLNVGRVPLQFLEDHIHAWIQETLSTGSSTAVSTAALSAMQMVVISLACCVLVSVVY